MFEKILLAVDGSDEGRKAISLARELATSPSAEVVVFHVHEKSANRFGSYDVDLSEAEQDVADETAKALKDDGFNARAETTTAYYGLSASRIVDSARDNDADVIVMGSRGLSDIKGLLLGSVAHKVLHLADRPVLIAR